MNIKSAIKNLNFKRDVLPFLILLILLIVDQTVKFVICKLHSEGRLPVVVIDGFFELIYSENRGAAFSFLSGQSWAPLFFMIFTPIVLCLFVFLFFYYRKKSSWIKYALILIISGALGNYVDRVYYSITEGAGHVVDFLSFNFGSLGKFATFNLADTFLCIGVVMALIFYLFLDEDALFKCFKKKKKVEEPLSEDNESQTNEEIKTDDDKNA